MIISTDIDNLFNKIKHTFMIKVLGKLEIEGDFLNLVNRSYETPPTDIVLNGEGLHAFCLRSVTRQGCLLPLFLFSNLLEVLVNAVGKKRKPKHAVWKEIRLPVFLDNHVMYI